jgi:hypothetical protein
MTVKAHLWKLFDSMQASDISGWALFEAMYARTGRKTYPQTLLDYCREYADISGAEFRCVDREKSIYRYAPGVQISGAIIDRRER